ncbi:hypothetical protein, conserved [Leishmania tarentolae]|uniref:Uncharacterized protein n=1 Tax=Leishmania tarentolae TaxID=5689 RepID=A0A640KM35_LEITA|nr:hypothetical protein, conserved [Leishmania tarentolae]
MQRFSHFLIQDSDSEGAEEAALRANQLPHVAEGSSNGSTAHECTSKDTLQSLSRITENGAPTQERPPAPPLEHTIATDRSPISSLHEMLPTSLDSHRLDGPATCQDFLLLPSYQHADGSAAAEGTPRSQQRDAVEAEEHDSAQVSNATTVPLHAEEVVAPCKKKPFFFCRLFSICKRKKPSRASIRGSEAQSAQTSVAEASTNIVTQDSPVRVNAAKATEDYSERTLSVPVAPGAASSNHSSAHSSKANCAQLKEEEIEGGEASLLRSSNGPSADRFAGHPVPYAALRFNEAKNRSFNAVDAEAAEDGGASEYSTLLSPSALQGFDAAHKESGDLAMAAAESGDLQKPVAKELCAKRVKAVVRRRRSNPVKGSGDSAGSTILDNAPDDSENKQRSAHSAEAGLVKASETLSVPFGREMSSEAASSASSVKGKQLPPLSHRDVAALQSPTQTHSGSYTGSGSYSYSYGYSRSYSTSSSLASSLTSPSRNNSAQEAVASDFAQRESAQESSALSGVRSARGASSASKRSHKATSILLQDDELPLSMPAYRRRVLLDLRARERRDAEEAAREWRDLTFRPRIYNPYNNGFDTSLSGTADRSHSPFSESHGFPKHSSVYTFSEPSPGRYRIHRISPRLLQSRRAPQQPAPPSFKPVISQYAKDSVKPRFNVFERLYKPRSSSPPAPGDAYPHKPEISKLASELFTYHPSEGANTTPPRRSVFDRLYNMHRSRSSSPTWFPSRSAMPKPSFKPQITEMALQRSAMLPKESFGDRLYRNSRSPRCEHHSPFRTHDEFRGDYGTEHVMTNERSKDGSSWSSQSSFAVRDTATVSMDLNRCFSQTQATVEGM